MLNYLLSLGDNEELSLSQISEKTAILIVLASLLRVSKLASTAFPSVTFSQSGMRFCPWRPRKAQRSGPLQSIFLPAFEVGKYCPAEALRSYIEKSRELLTSSSGDSSLFIAITAQGSDKQYA